MPEPVTSGATLLLLGGGAMTMLIAGVEGPATSDVYAVVGAFLASFVALTLARKTKKSDGNLIAVVICSAVIGSMGPGATFYYFWPEVFKRLNWQAWVTIGFFFGFAGYPIVMVFNSLVTNRLPSIANFFITRFTGVKEPTPQEVAKSEIISTAIRVGVEKQAAAMQTVIETQKLLP